jgi:Tfp pilus assembly protein PilO
VTLTDRDRKIVLVLIPIVVLFAYWFLLLTPKREEAAKAGEELAAQELRRDGAQQRVDSLSGARTDFAADYAQLVRLGKAVPSTVDMPTVLVQLEDAAKGTDIKFTRITAAERQPAVAPAPAAPSDGSQPAAAGGAPAQSAPGTAAESTGDAVATANGNNAAAAEQSGVAPSDTQTSETTRDGALPVGGGSPTDATTTAGGIGAPGLDTVPITLEFVGNFFDLANFFHRIKRYVETSKDGVEVRGRLLTVEGVEFKGEADLFPRITATLTATAYLAPQAEGVTAGATPSGPGTVPASTPAQTVSAAPTPPTATATR